MSSTATADALPLDFYVAQRAILAALRDQAKPASRDHTAGLTAEQRKKLRGTNFMTPERITYVRAGGFTVEIATGTFMESRMIGITAFRLGGEREGDYELELSACVHSLDAMRAQLAKIAEA